METQQLKPHILTIDDDKTFSEVLKQTIARDCRVTSFYDPYKAMAAMNTTRFDLILLDMKMPNLSGRQVLELALDRCRS